MHNHRLFLIYVRLFGLLPEQPDILYFVGQFEEMPVIDLRIRIIYRFYPFLRRVSDHPRQLDEVVVAPDVQVVGVF